MVQMVQVVQDDKIAKHTHPPQVRTLPRLQDCKMSNLTCNLAPRKIEQDDQDGQNLGHKERASFPSTR